MDIILPIIEKRGNSYRTLDLENVIPGESVLKRIPIKTVQVLTKCYVATLTVMAQNIEDKKKRLLQDVTLVAASNCLKNIANFTHSTNN